MTEILSALRSFLSRVLGMPDYEFVVIDHPVIALATQTLDMARGPSTPEHRYRGRVKPLGLPGRL